VLQQFEHLPQMQDLEAFILKLEQHIGSQGAPQNPTLLFEHKPASTGVRWLRTLHEHIEKHDVIKLRYEPFPNDEKDLVRWEQTGTEIHIHPYFLKESKNLWYVFGLNHAKNRIENYALDRIQGIEKAPHFFFKPNETLDSRSYFDDIVGVTKYDEQPLEVFVVKVNAIIAPYWMNRPLHASQKLIEQTPSDAFGTTPQYFWFSFDLRWNYEWQSLLLSYGANVEVLEPLWFRDNLRRIFRDARAMYEC
jgi:predicted DNA-binding transcriptional regulator YafY